MIVLHDAQNQSVTYPLAVDDDKWFILHRLDGEDELEFELSLEDEMTAKILEEMLVDANGNQYVVKNVDEHSNFMTVTCVVNLDDFKAEFIRHVLYRNAFLSDVLTDILPDGWLAVGDTSITRKATIGSDDGVATYDNLNAYDVLFLAQEAYGVTFNFNAITKILTVIDRSEVQSSGSYLMEDLNLESVGYVGSTKAFATRLYAYGKMDEETGQYLTFASINDGKEYIEDHSYSNKVISVGWTDERYTVKENLLADARKKLAALALPQRSYACNAKNVLDDVYVTKVITLVDKRRRQRVDHMVVEWKEYSRSDMDVITLSQSQPTITKSLNERFEELTREVNMGDTMMKAFVNDVVQNATDSITGNRGGVFKWIFDAQGRPIELLNLGDTYDPSTAQKVWRWNAAGLGHSNTGYSGTYDLALLADGSINASVITTGVLNANIIRAGRISDLTSLNYWDLESGVMQFGKGRITSADSKNYWEVQGGALHVERGEIGGYTIESNRIYNDFVELTSNSLEFYAYNTSGGVSQRVLVSSLIPGWLTSQSGDVTGSLYMRVPMNFQMISRYPADGTELLVFNYSRSSSGALATFQNFGTISVTGDVLFTGNLTCTMSNVKILSSLIDGYQGTNKLGDARVFQSSVVYGDKIINDTGYNVFKNGVGVCFTSTDAIFTSNNVDSLGRLRYAMIDGSGFRIGRHNVVSDSVSYGGTRSILVEESAITCWKNTSMDSSNNKVSFKIYRDTNDVAWLVLRDATDDNRRISLGGDNMYMYDTNNYLRCWIDYYGIQCRNASGYKKMNLNLTSLTFYDDYESIKCYVMSSSSTSSSSYYGMRIASPGFISILADEIGVGSYSSPNSSATYSKGETGGIRVPYYDSSHNLLGYWVLRFKKGFMISSNLPESVS